MKRNNIDTPNRLSFDLRVSTNKQTKRLVEYLSSENRITSHRELILKAISDYYLLFSTPKDASNFEEIRMESIVALEAQLKLLYTYDGQGYRNDISQYGQIGVVPQHSIHSNHIQSLPIAQPVSVVQTEIDTNSINPISATEIVEISKTSQSEEINVEDIDLSTSASFNFATLEAVLDKLLVDLNQERASGRNGIKTEKIIRDLDPQDEEIWTEEMWELYDNTLSKVEDINDPLAAIRTKKSS